MLMVSVRPTTKSLAAVQVFRRQTSSCSTLANSTQPSSGTPAQAALRSTLAAVAGKRPSRTAVLARAD